MSGIEQRIWEWMPKRRDRSRVTTPTVVAANLDLPVRDVTAAMDRMTRNHHLFATPRGGYYRGVPLPQNKDH